MNGYLSDKISPIAGVPQGSVLSAPLFLLYVNDLPNPHHRQNSKSQFADDTALLYGLLLKMYNLQQKCFVRTSGNWQNGVLNGE